MNIRNKLRSLLIENNIQVNLKKALEDIALKDKKVVAKAAEMVFNDAAYHIGSLSSKSDLISRNYKGEQPFTGHYFVSQAEEVVLGGTRKVGDSRAFMIIDFSGYNLLRPEDWNEYNNIKWGLVGLANLLGGGDYSMEKVRQSLNKLPPNLTNRIKRLSDVDEVYIMQRIGALERSIPKVRNNREYEELGAEIERLEGIISGRGENDWESIISGLASKFSNNMSGLSYGAGGIDRLETTILKKVGYEGIDVRGVPDADTFSEGSVIFDLHPNTYTSLPDAYLKAKSDGGNPNLVNYIDSII